MNSIQMLSFCKAVLPLRIPLATVRRKSNFEIHFTLIRGVKALSHL